MENLQVEARQKEKQPEDSGESYALQIEQSTEEIKVTVAIHEKIYNYPLVPSPVRSSSPFVRTFLVPPLVGLHDLWMNRVCYPVVR